MRIAARSGEWGGSRLEDADGSRPQRLLNWLWMEFGGSVEGRMSQEELRRGQWQVSVGSVLAQCWFNG